MVLDWFCPDSSVDPMPQQFYRPPMPIRNFGTVHSIQAAMYLQSIEPLCRNVDQEEFNNTNGMPFQLT